MPSDVCLVFGSSTRGPKDFALPSIETDLPPLSWDSNVKRDFTRLVDPDVTNGIPPAARDIL